MPLAARASHIAAPTRALGLHGWHYVIEDGEVHVFDIDKGGFVPASPADNAGTGPYRAHEPQEMGELDASGVPSG